MASVVSLVSVALAPVFWPAFDARDSGAGNFSNTSSTLPPTNSIISMTFFIRSMSEMTGIPAFVLASSEAWKVVVVKLAEN